jgi:hypothetical protein
LYRLLGEAALAHDVSSDMLDTTLSESGTADDAAARSNAAESYFRRAMDLAREQGGKSLELRASVSLGKLLVTEQRIDEARTLVEPLHNFFAGQRPTPDSAAAGQILDAPSR